MASKKEDLVEVFIPKGYINEEPNLLVSVNGVNDLLPRGKRSQVPAHIAAEIRRAQEAQAALDEKVAELLSQQ